MVGAEVGLMFFVKRTFPHCVAPAQNRGAASRAREKHGDASDNAFTFAPNTCPRRLGADFAAHESRSIHSHARWCVAQRTLCETH
jgi:hypothetical protein